MAGQGGHAAYAADFPDHSIDVVVPMAAGGPTDLVARLVQKSMSKQLGASVVVENKAGAGGMIGVNQIKHATADGYTLGIASSTTHAVAINVYESLSYDPIKDFTPIGNIVVAPGVLIVSPKVAPGCKLAAFIDDLKKHPDEVKYGSSGIGTLSQMSGVRFMSATHTEMLHVPYKGLSAVMNDMYAGLIDAAFDNVGSALPHIQSGKVCALAVQAPHRLAVLPDVPTYAELGYPELNKPTWYGLVAPAGTPAPVVQKLNAALNHALADPEVVAAFQRLGLTPAPSTPTAFARQIKEEIAMWKQTTDQMHFQKIAR